MNIEMLPRLRLQTISLAVLAAILTWLVVSRSYAAYLAAVAPESALWFEPQQPDALVNLADQRLNGQSLGQASAAEHALPIQQGSSEDAIGANPVEAAGSPAINSVFSAFDVFGHIRTIDIPAIHAWVERALRNEPLNARALRLSGQVADATRDEASAWKFMQAAAHLSLHETIADYWLMRKGAEEKRYKTAIHYADAMLRTTPQFANYVMPILTRIAEDKSSNNLLESVLADDPPWRQQFLAAFPNDVTDARAPLDLLLALRTSSAPPTPTEIEPYLDLLVQRKFYDLAYYTWLQFLPSEQLRNAGLLFNGNFEIAPTGLPFDWVITQGTGVSVDIVPRTDKDREAALLVDFQYGRVDYRSVSELVMLVPGSYQFDGQYKGGLIGPRGMKWRIVCADSSTTPIGESSMIGEISPAWRDFKFAFTVPSSNCRAQFVRLDLDARMASEQLVSGSMLFSELRISRQPTDRSDSAQP